MRCCQATSNCLSPDPLLIPSLPIQFIAALISQDIMLIRLLAVHTLASNAKVQRLQKLPFPSSPPSPVPRERHRSLPLNASPQQCVLDVVFGVSTYSRTHWPRLSASCRDKSEGKRKQRRTPVGRISRPPIRGITRPLVACLAAISSSLPHICTPLPLEVESTARMVFLRVQYRQSVPGSRQQCRRSVPSISLP